MKQSVFQQRLTLLFAGISLEALYLLYLLRPFPLIPNFSILSSLGTMTLHSPTAFWGFIFVFTMLFSLFIFSWYTVRNLSDKSTFWIIVGFGLLYGLTLSFVYPVTATDVYNYVAQSRVLTYYHQNPMFVPANTYSNDPIMTMTGGWGRFTSPYGPLGILLHALPSYLWPGNLLANLLALKMLFSFFLLATAYVVYKIVHLSKPKSATAAMLFVAWNPLLLFEVSVNGHNDIAMMVIAVYALFIFIKKQYVWGTLLLILSALLKYVTIILLPVFIMYALLHLHTTRQRIWYILSVIFGGVLIVSLFYAPFWRGTETLSRALFENSIYLGSFSSFLGLMTNYNYYEAAVIGRTIFLSFYAYFLFRLVTKKEDILRISFWIMIFFLLFAVTNFKIWYVIWPVVLAAAVPKVFERGTVTILAYFATLTATIFGYVYVWLGQNNPTNFAIVNSVSFLIIFIPALLFFVGGLVLFKWKKVQMKK